MAKRKEPVRLSIDELEKILQRDDDTPLEILPNGTVKVGGCHRRKQKPLTLKQNIGSEYGITP